jgi:hypothetical protein
METGSFAVLPLGALALSSQIVRVCADVISGVGGDTEGTISVYVMLDLMDPQFLVRGYLFRESQGYRKQRTSGTYDKRSTVALRRIRKGHKSPSLYS